MNSSMEYKHVLLDVKNAVGFITLNQPQIRNPIGNPVKLELMDALAYCEKNDEIRMVVLRGAGGVFSAGGDMNAMKERLDRGEYGTWESCRLGGELNLKLLNLKKPTVAVVEGAAAGSGLCMALSCDFQIVTEDAKMVFAFVNIGYVPDSGATCLVTRAVGTVRAKDILMSGRRFSGRDAAAWGLVTEAVPQEQIEERLSQYIEKYANGPTKAYGYIKEMVNRSVYHAFEEGTEMEVEFQTICERTNDHKESVYAFFEKRRPKFKGD